MMSFAQAPSPSMSTTDSSLSALLSTTPYLLAYSIPLLLVSIPLTFCGTFLTLDRSRSFPSSVSPFPLPGSFDGAKPRAKFTFPLHGGIGGLASGYVLGVHLSTFLSVLVPAVSSSGKLSSNSFLPIWILSCIPTTLLGGRYRYCARTFAAVSGGSLLGLGISLIIHPPLLPRQVLTVLLAVLLLFLSLLFSFPRLIYLLRPTLRVATASSGSFGFILSIALLSHIPAWANIWERLWLQDGEGWGSSKEKGLSAAYCILFCLGIATDYALKRWLGECPDEKWDKYLANYSANPPNDASRAGTFAPLSTRSFWARLFGPPSQQSKKDILSPPPLLSQRHPRGSMTKDSAALLSNDEDRDDWPKASFSEQRLPYDDLPSPPTFLKKVRSQSAKFKPPKKHHVGPGRKRPIKFGGDLSSDSSDEDSDSAGRPWLRQKLSMSSSSPTLVEETKHELGKLKRARARTGLGPSEIPDYSDCEEDLGSSNPKLAVTAGDREWSPRFLKLTSSAEGSHTDGSGTSSMDGGVPAVLPVGAVPATPSLIKALDRISIAQRDAFGNGSPLTPTSTQPPSSLGAKKSPGQLDGLPMVDELDSGDENDEVGRKRQQLPGWEEFWKEVKHKARS